MAAKENTRQDQAQDITDQTVEIGDFDVTTLRDIESFDDAYVLLVDTYGAVEDASQVIGSGFTLTGNNGKMHLIDVPFLVVRMAFPESDKFKRDGVATHYAVLHIITEDGRKLIITDGGVGIYQQCEEWSVRSGKRGGLLVRGGLRVSTYEIPEEDGGGEGTTYYLNV